MFYQFVFNLITLGCKDFKNIFIIYDHTRLLRLSKYLNSIWSDSAAQPFKILTFFWSDSATEIADFIDIFYQTRLLRFPKYLHLIWFDSAAQIAELLLNWNTTLNNTIVNTINWNWLHLKCNAFQLNRLDCWYCKKLNFIWTSFYTITRDFRIKNN